MGDIEAIEAIEAIERKRLKTPQCDVFAEEDLRG